jgi:hypothetical protein
MKEYLRLNEKNIDKYKSKYNWQGSGLEVHDPLVIDSLNKQYRKLKLKRMKRVIDITDLSLDYVYLNSCRYVTIEGCKFRYFNLTSCRNIVVRDNFLPKFVLLYSKNNKIIGNQISERDFEMIKNSLGEREDNKKLNWVIWIILGLIFYIISFGGTRYSTYVYLCFFIIVFGVLVYLKLLISHLIKKANALPDNVFIDNIRIPIKN